ncbi:MAG: hypothetical protein RLY71_2091 [Pseudomonadota bacterium]|jgi:hypothetical protein
MDCEIHILPKKEQKELLDFLFLGPKLIARLLQDTKDEILTPTDASLFILKNKSALEPYLATQNRSNAINLLKSLVLQWHTNPPDQFAIFFNHGCYINEYLEIYLPIPNLGFLEPSLPHFVDEIKRKYTYGSNYILMAYRNSYFIHATFTKQKTAPGNIISIFQKNTDTNIKAKKFEAAVAKPATPAQKHQMARQPTHQTAHTAKTSKCDEATGSGRTALPSGVICVLCGERVRPGDMLMHKEKAHGEKRVVPSPGLPHRKGHWVSICSGGLPSLGKRSK